MSKRGNQDNVVRGRLGRTRWRVRPIRHQTDLLKFWPEARRKRSNYWGIAALWGGAVLIGGAYGAGHLTPRQPSQPSAPIEWNAVQAVPKAVEDPSDRKWRERATTVGAPETQPAERRAEHLVSFGLCHTGGGSNCVVDGDTIWFRGQDIRIADIDAPETHEPRCASELALGNRATARLYELVNSGEVTLTPIDRDEDSYGRKLRIVQVNGNSVGDTLVGEGLARWYQGGRRSWCA